MSAMYLFKALMIISATMLVATLVAKPVTPQLPATSDLLLN